MSYRELSMIDVREVLRRWAAGHSNRKIERETGNDRGTAARYISVAERLTLPRDRELSDAEIHEVAQRIQARPLPDPSAERKAVAEHKEQSRRELRHATPLRDGGARLAEEGGDDPSRRTAGGPGGAGRLRQDGDNARRRDGTHARALGAHRQETACGQRENEGPNRISLAAVGEP